MRGFNKAILMGNLARDPELKYTASQRAVATFAVAINRAWKDANGEYKEDVTFIPVVVWGSSAEFCQKYFHKGSGILVEGRINVRNYEDKNGVKKYVTEVIADNIQFAGSSGNGQQGSYQQNDYQQDNNDYRPVPQSQRRYSQSTAASRNRKPSAPGFDPNEPITLDGMEPLQPMQQGAPTPMEEANIPF